MLTNHKKQTLNLRKEEPIYITTPGGIIEIKRCGGDTRKLEITLPKNFEAVIGEGKLKSTYFLKVVRVLSAEPKFKVTPEFTVLVPCFAGKDFIGVEKPSKFTLVEEEDGDPNVEDNPGHEEVADVAEECDGNGHPAHELRTG